MCNVLEELDGRVEVDQRGGAARSTSELLPRIDVSRGPKAKPPRPATPLKKPGDRSRRRGGSSGGDTPTSGRSNNSLPQISSGLSSPIPHVDDDPGTPQPELD